MFEARDIPVPTGLPQTRELSRIGKHVMSMWAIHSAVSGKCKCGCKHYPSDWQPSSQLTIVTQLIATGRQEEAEWFLERGGL